MILVSIYLIARLEVPKEREMPKPLDKEKVGSFYASDLKFHGRGGADLNHRPFGL